jgi:hypothetical protein
MVYNFCLIRPVCLKLLLMDLKYAEKYPDSSYILFDDNSVRTNSIFVYVQCVVMYSIVVCPCLLPNPPSYSI